MASRRPQGIGLNYVLTSGYFIMNMIAVLIYPTLRLIGMKQKSQLDTD